MVIATSKVSAVVSPGRGVVAVFVRVPLGRRVLWPKVGGHVESCAWCSQWGYQCTWPGLRQRVSRRCTATMSVVVWCFVACCVARVCRVAWFACVVVLALLFSVGGLGCHSCLFRGRFGVASPFALCDLPALLLVFEKLCLTSVVMLSRKLYAGRPSLRPSKVSW